MSQSDEPSNVRREYDAGKLSRDSLDADPIKQFERWFAEIRAQRVIDPTAMSLATVDAQGRPSQRTVLLKGFDDEGFVFFTNLQSRKARHLQVNNRASLHFLWSALDRQISIQGHVKALSATFNAEYFATRPRESQIAAWVSQQSEAIDSRKVLDDKFAALQTQYEGQDIPMPPYWGGYRIVPDEIEFWQGGVHRLHDRFVYSLPEDTLLEGNAGWRIQRLSP